MEQEKRFIPNQFKSVQLGIKNAGKTSIRIGKKVHRNEPCPCGKQIEIIANGKTNHPILVTPKFKNCCIND